MTNATHAPVEYDHVRGHNNDLALSEGYELARSRSVFTDSGENADLVRQSVLWRMMTLVDETTFRRLVAEAVEFVTPEPSL